MKNRFLPALFFFLSLCGVVFLYLYWDSTSSHIISQIRFPRMMLTILTGFVLGSCGFAFQMLLDNPLAEPYILGVSSGAALASIAAGAAGMYLLMPFFGFLGALAAMLLVYFLAGAGGMFSGTRLLLSGVIVGMFLSSLISLFMYFNQDDIGNIINVLMGNLGHVFSNMEWKIFKAVSIIAVILLIWLVLQGRRLLLLSTGDQVAGSLGLNVKSFRIQIFVVCSLLTGITVSFAGIIGFVGLIVPHLVRLFWGGNKANSILFSGIGGAVFLLVCDLLARHIMVIELPVGIITSFTGCPVFIYLLWKRA